MAAITISEEEAIRDLPSLLVRVRGGEEIAISSGDKPTVILKAERMDPSIDATLARMKAIRDRDGEDAFHMGSDFADDLEEIIRQRKPADRSAWD